MSLAITARLARGRVPRSGGVVVAALFLAVLALAALWPGLFTRIDPLQTEISNALAAPSLAHPFGTDQTGRDVFSRVVYGTQHSLVIGLAATLLALVGGLIVGTIAGIAPRAVDTVLSRIIDVLMAFPELLIALLVIAIVGPGESSLVVALAIAGVAVYARVSRIQTLVVRRSGYVRAAKTLGVHPLLTVVRHVVPNTLSPLLVMATIGFGTSIAAAAGLSFLGLGSAPPTPEWGLILSEGRNFLGTAWWIAVFPGLAVTGTVIAATVVGRRLLALRAGSAS